MVDRQYMIKVNLQGAIVAFCTLDGTVVQVASKRCQTLFQLDNGMEPIGHSIVEYLEPNSELTRIINTHDTSTPSVLVRSRANGALLWIQIEPVGVTAQMRYCVTNVCSPSMRDALDVNAFLLDDETGGFDFDDDSDEEVEAGDIADALMTLGILQC